MDVPTNNITSIPNPITAYQCQLTQNILQQLPDPVKLLSPALEVFLPIGNDETITMIGLWYDTLGTINIYLQQAIIPDNIYTQVRIIRLRLPVAIGTSIFSLAYALFIARSSILAIRATASKTAEQIQQVIDRMSTMKITH